MDQHVVSVFCTQLMYCSTSHTMFIISPLPLRAAVQPHRFQPFVYIRSVAQDHHLTKDLRNCACHLTSLRYLTPLPLVSFLLCDRSSANHLLLFSSHISCCSLSLFFCASSPCSLVTVLFFPQSFPLNRSLLH